MQTSLRYTLVSYLLKALLFAKIRRLCVHSQFTPEDIDV
ncbi:hypothetical protein PPIS_a1166 [Pseudoalteromonas piscicida]|uniref:Uncharacterized protein n=1 Tax=Pseudoalteromonas piscicida TaxID=43662 RepID=A0ABN5CA41_PSEO7|nr:hypothetical protein PPIS_a1166 [Pseudoalteromonas piscicida]